MKAKVSLLSKLGLVILMLALTAGAGQAQEPPPPVGEEGMAPQSADDHIFPTMSYQGNLLPAGSLLPEGSYYTFHAVYDRVVGSEDLDEPGINHAVMSGDGQKLALATYHHIATVNADGSNLVSYPEPDLSWGINTLAINQDGSRVFFDANIQGSPGSPDRLYKLENGVISEILNVATAPIGDIGAIRTTADGSYVYFIDQEPDDWDLWRVAHDGSGLAIVIEDSSVPYSGGGFGAQVAQYDISADASVIAFTMLRPKKELYVKKGGAYHQLTNGNVSDIIYPAISGDGTTITFQGPLDDSWYSIRSDGSNLLPLVYSSYNTGGNVLTYNGAQMFYNDNSGNGGRLVSTNGSGNLDLVPGYPIPLSASGDLSISYAGDRVAFNYYEGTSQYGLYVGHFNNPKAAPSAPHINYIAFNPSAMPNDDPNARVTLTTHISDTLGLADIARTSTGQLVGGVREGYTSKLPVYFPHPVKDDGNPPDQVAGDGIFSSEGRPGGKIADLDQVTVRVGVQDDSKDVTIADTTLFTGSSGQMPILPPTMVQAQSGKESIALTWNPSVSSGLDGYNVYRATVSTGPWTKINTGLVSGDRYVDASALVANTTYFYHLTAVGNSTESQPSNLTYAIYGQLKLFIPHSYGAAGETVTLPVSIANADGLEMCAVDIFVTYDPSVLTATNVEKTALTASYAWSQNLSTPGVVKASIAAATSGEMLYGEGALFNILFDVIGSAGDTSDLAFQVTGTEFYDCGDLSNPVPLDLSDVGVFTVQSAYILGDLNGDGDVTLADAFVALEIAVSNVIPSPQQQAAGDLNGDGRINAADGCLVMRLAAGLPIAPAAMQARALDAALAGSVEISAPSDATAPEGGSAWVALSIDDASNVAGVEITLNYDPFVLTAAGARTTTLSANFDVAFNVPAAGQAIISLKPKSGHEGGLTGGSGALVEVQFSPTSSATAGSSSPLNLANVRLSDTYGRDFATSALQVEVTTTSGALTVGAGGGMIYLPLVTK